jgi:outer membrane protein TolC
MGGSVARGAEVLELEQAVAMAIEGNRRVENAEMEANKAEEGVAVLRTDRLPRLDFTGGSRYNLTTQGYEFDEGVLGTYPVIGPIPGRNTVIESESGLTSLLSLSLVQPLTQLYLVDLGIEHQEAISALAAEQLRADRQHVVKDVKDQYYRIVQLRSDLEATKQAIVFYQGLDELVTRYVEEEVALAYEQMEVEARLARREHDRLRQSNELLTAKERMNELLGRDIATRFDVTPLPEMTPPIVDPEEARQAALQHRPDVLEARLRVESANLRRRITKSGYIPDIDLKVDYAKLYNVEFIPDAIATAGVLARWEFYDFGRKRHQMAQDSDSIRQAGNTLRETEARAVIQVNEAIRKLEEAGQQIGVARLRKKAAEEKLRVRMNQYREHTVLLDEVLRAESQLEEATNAYTRSALAVRRAEAELEQAMGSE